MSKLSHRLPRRRTQSLDVSFSSSSSANNNKYSTHKREVSLHNLEDAPLPPPSLIMDLSTPTSSPIRKRAESDGGGRGYKTRVSALLSLPSIPSLSTSAHNHLPSAPSSSSQQSPSSPKSELFDRSKSFTSSPQSWRRSFRTSTKKHHRVNVNSWDGSSDLSSSPRKIRNDINQNVITTPGTEKMSQRSSSWDGTVNSPSSSYTQKNPFKLEHLIDLEKDDSDDDHDHDRPNNNIEENSKEKSSSSLSPPITSPPTTATLPPPPPGISGDAATLWLGKKSSSDNGDHKEVQFSNPESFIDELSKLPNEDKFFDGADLEKRNNRSLEFDSSKELLFYSPMNQKMSERMDYNNATALSSSSSRRRQVDFEDDYEYDEEENMPPTPASAASRNATNKKKQPKKNWLEKIWCYSCCPISPPRKPSWTRLSSFIVRHAPCFWYCVSPLETSATDRSVLYRLNILCAVFASVQVAVGIMMLILLVAYPTDGYSEDGFDRGINLWDLNTTLFLLALVSVVLFGIVVYSLKFIRQVNIVGALRYMWALYWILPIDIFLVISLFDYHRVTNVWVKHWWLAPVMEWFRTLFCESGTAHEECMVPIGGGENFTSSTDWCLFYYNATNCDAIRDAAESNTNTWCYVFYTANGIWGILLVVLLLLTLDVLQGIITSPIVQASKEANIPAWLTLPIAGCFALGCIFFFAPSSVTASGDDNVTGVQWIGSAYMVAAGTFTISALLGWFLSAFSVTNSQDKKRKKIAVTLFILTMILTILSVGAIFATSLVYSVNVAPVSLSDEERGSIACSIDGGVSCTNCCDDCDPQCPEWTEEDVVKVLRTQLKLSATLAAIFFIYGFSALRFGFVLRSHIVKYQIEYV